MYCAKLDWDSRKNNHFLFNEGIRSSNLVYYIPIAVWSILASLPLTRNSMNLTNNTGMKAGFSVGLVGLLVLILIIIYKLDLLKDCCK